MQNSHVKPTFWWICWPHNNFYGYFSWVFLINNVYGKVVDPHYLFITHSIDTHYEHTFLVGGLMAKNEAMDLPAHSDTFL